VKSSGLGGGNGVERIGTLGGGVARSALGAIFLRDALKCCGLILLGGGVNNGLLIRDRNVFGKGSIHVLTLVHKDTAPMAFGFLEACDRTPVSLARESIEFKLGVTYGGMKRDPPPSLCASHE